MRAAWLTALGIAAYLLFLALLAPASIVMAKADLPPGVSLGDVRGTLWNGSARATVRQGSASLAIDRVEWHFVPSQLFTGRLAFDLRAESPKLHASGRLAHGFGGLSARDVAVSGDAATLATLFPMAAPWNPQGAVAVSAPALRWNDREVVGDATAEWRDAAVSFPQPRALGSYRAELHGTGGPAKLSVTTLSGGYAVRGEGSVTPQRFEVKGQADGQDFALRLP